MVPLCPAKFKSQSGHASIFAQAPGLQPTAQVCDEPDRLGRATPDEAADAPEFEGTSSASPGR
jgi:hypothetical protein